MLFAHVAQNNLDTLQRRDSQLVKGMRSVNGSDFQALHAPAVRLQIERSISTAPLKQFQRVGVRRRRRFSFLLQSFTDTPSLVPSVSSRSPVSNSALLICASALIASGQRLIILL